MTDRSQRYLLDVNVLVALAAVNHVDHRAAHRALGSVAAWSTTPLTENALLRLLLNPTVTGNAWTMRDITAVLAGMHDDPRWSWLPDDLSPLASSLDLGVLIGHRQVTDVHLVGLAARHGLVLATFDTRIRDGLAARDRRHVEVLSSTS